VSTTCTRPHPTSLAGLRIHADGAVCFRFATFSSLAGVDPSDDPGEGVPPSDSLDMWPVLAGTNGTSPRTSAALTASTLVVGDYKYIAHQPAVHDAAWVTAEYPDGNFTIGPACQPCLFNVRLDPEERTNLNETEPDLTAKLADELAAQTHFQTGDDHYSGPYTQCMSLANFTSAHRGFLGPLCTKGG